MEPPHLSLRKRGLSTIKVANNGFFFCGFVGCPVFTILRICSQILLFGYCILQTYVRCSFISCVRYQRFVDVDGKYTAGDGKRDV